MTKAIVAATIFLSCLFSFTGCDILDDRCLRRPDAEQCNE